MKSLLTGIIKGIAQMMNSKEVQSRFYGSEKNPPGKGGNISHNQVHTHIILQPACRCAWHLHGMSPSSVSVLGGSFVAGGAFVGGGGGGGLVATGGGGAALMAGGGCVATGAGCRGGSGGGETAAAASDGSTMRGGIEREESSDSPKNLSSSSSLPRVEAGRCVGTWG